MTELPPGWADVPLADVAEVRLGRQRSPKNHSGDNMRPYLRAANVTWQGLNLDDVKEMHFSSSEVATYRLRAGDIVMSEASGSAGEVGKPAVWRGELQDCCFQNTLIRVRGIGATAPEFLLHRLRFEALLGKWSQEMARGVGIHHLGATRLSTWNLALPPLAEQQRIVDELERRLSHIDAAVSGLGKARRQLRIARAAVLDDMCWRREYDLRPLADLLSEKLANGRSVKDRSGGFPVLRLTCLKRGRIDLTEVKEGDWSADEAKRFLVYGGDFLVARGNGSLHLVGRGGLVGDAPEEVAYPDTLIRVRVNRDVLLPEYLALVWDSSGVRQQIESVARTTAGIYKVNQSHLESVTLPVPAVGEQRTTVDEIERRLSLIDAAERTIEASLRKAELLRHSLLAAAFSGRLVPQDPDDEPAEHLLERIRTERAAATPTKKARKKKDSAA